MTKQATYRVASNSSGFRKGELNVLFAGESQTNSLHRIGPKVVDYYLLHHVLSGRGLFRMGDIELNLGEGDSFLIYPGTLFHYVSDENNPWKYRWVAFSGSAAAALVKEAGFEPERPYTHTGGDSAPGERCRAIFEAFRGRSGSAALAASGHFHLLLASLREASEDSAPEAPRPGTHSEELARQVIGYLSTQYAEPITIEGMAETLGYNRAYLSRIFKQHAGMSPATFLTKLRVDHGRRLLRERPELTVEQIASSVGFQDALYFSKQFRRWYAQSPTEYRTAVDDSLKTK
ncbi:AraC family transcriptional regulator [Cohnella phaseoli]|uniref:AraC-like protein n=1 Tax=Cohnella phaseoli TaxID=456490 RepID=A0A3D9I3Y1_9BACL|nr:AraC family transcriptional regulator [Cohnella phaseoli]RED56492.1 AraC-like protein [Cohnella phaseoli]